MEDLFEGQKRSKSRSRSPRAALPATGTGDGRDLPEVENSETPEEVLQKWGNMFKYGVLHGSQVVLLQTNSK